ncbi:MAG: DUF1987 domain-containing protein [Flavobacteriales bacterium]|jgi:hypothetical protein
MIHLQPIELKATEDTPEVRFSAADGLLVISGRSLPENAWQFYQPLIDWTRAYCAASAQETLLELKLDYFNSSSGRFLFELLTILENRAGDKSKVQVNWHVDHDDELMIEKGQELKGLLEIPFRIVIQ